MILSLNDLNARSLDPADKQFEFDRNAVQNGITANAGGGQANAVLLNFHFNRVTTVGTAADSVKLPPAVVGTLPIVVFNAAAANSMNVFPSTGDSINALSANAAYAHAANKGVMFVCMVNGVWNTIPA